MSDEVNLPLSIDRADALHADLEKLLDEGNGTPAVEYAYRTLGWKILAAKGGSGLTGRISDLARKSGTLEEYEAARDEELGPILGGLENPSNRDP